MGIKIRKKIKNAKSQESSASKGVPDPEYIEVGKGGFAVVTMPRNGGPTVVHRFETEEEARAQHDLNMAQDKPLVGFTGLD